MGLDSVELIYTVERYFNIEIKDAEAEQIGTVGAMVACVAAHLQIAPDTAASSVYQAMHDNVCCYLKQLLPQQMIITAATPLREIVKFADWDAAFFQRQLETGLGLEVPTLLYTWPVGGLGVPFRFFGSNRRQKPQQVSTTFKDLIGWLLAANYKTVFVLPWLSYYDVQQAAVGLISECLSVPVPEIQLTDSFTNDLGVD
ncbi:hypothetical protein [Hymenobacter sp. YC55]|uniref:hypothetical protein n=1 Tax=Hymenobacter sp. YC55 TaxID=3034019 RepID=UPI0023F8111B|nr:hypothetical protein [Hymenobacter sp. YC55]MDF7813246.1 hypothetical protein [Hymenobacter sp. YC55]